jgi:hypothetical protein
MCKKSALVVVLLWVAAGALAQEIDEPIISPRFEYADMRRGIFAAYASGAAEGNYYYMLPTNAYSEEPTSALPKGTCRYNDLVSGNLVSINEQVVGYRGDNTFAFLQSTNPRFTRFRTVSPCFTGRSGEESEQQHRTFAYGAGSTVVSTIKSKVYLTVNRTRFRNNPGTSTSPYELASTGAEWQTGDFDQIFIGAQTSLNNVVSAPTSTSGFCLGDPNPPASETCNAAFAWKLVPIVRITDGLVDPVDGRVKTFTALPPLLAEVNAATQNLPIFSGISSGAVLFGFMEFGHICVTWDTTKNPPRCTEHGFPSRLAAVFLTDTSTTIRPSGARLHFKKGNQWIAMNADGTFPVVPDDFASTLGVFSLSDIKFNPINSTWNVWTDETILTDATTPGCADPESPTTGSRLVSVNLTTYAKTAFWPSQNIGGRRHALAHYVLAPACNCLREFIFYSSGDYACYHLNASSQGSEVLVRRRLDGPPNQ